MFKLTISSSNVGLIGGCVNLDSVADIELAREEKRDGTVEVFCGVDDPLLRLKPVFCLVGVVSGVFLADDCPGGEPPSARDGDVPENHAVKPPLGLSIFPRAPSPVYGMSSDNGVGNLCLSGDLDLFRIAMGSRLGNESCRWWV